MRRVKALIFLLFLVLASISALVCVGEPKTADGNATVVQGLAADAAPVQAAYGRVPIFFVPNAGLMDARVHYYGRGPGYGVYFTPEEVVFAFGQPPPQSHGRETSTAVQARTVSFSEEAQATRRVTLALRFLGANPEVRLEGQREGTSKVNYLIGSDPAQWRTGLSTYGEVVYRGLWPGVDLVFRAANGGLKYEFVVQPGARVETIQLAYRGVEGLSLDAEGNLLISTPLGVLTDARPQSYQEIEDRQVPVASRFALEPLANGESGYGFVVGTEYDPRYSLIIDPGLEYSTFLGGSANDSGNAIVVDGAGKAYVTGETSSSNFPTTVGAFDTTSNGGMDAFVAKLNTNGSLVYCTYLGDRENDTGLGIAVDASGNAYVTGQTFSGNFPTTLKAYSTKISGKSDAFVAKLNTNGLLVYSTFLGGGGPEAGYAIAVDTSGNAYVTGLTQSANFPTTAGAYDQSSNGSDDAFVTKLTSTGAGLVYSTFLGGTGVDIGYGIAVDSSGNAYVTGETSSAGFPIPTTAGAYDRTFNGGVDAFVTKLTSTGAGLVYSTFLGGTGVDIGHAMAVDSSDNAYVTGATSSAGFPTTAGAYDRTFNFNGGVDAFVTKLTSTESGLVYSTFLGGTGVDIGHGIGVDSLGNAYVTGETSSSNFPTTAGAHAELSNGGVDAFVTKLTSTGSGLLYSTYLGGSSDDRGHGMAVDSSGNAYVTGETSSSNFPTTTGAYDQSSNGGVDAFVTKLAANNPPVLASIGNKSINELATLSFTLSATDADAGQTLTYSISAGTLTGMTLNGSTGAFSWTPTEAQGPGQYQVTFRVTDNGTPPLFDEETITITVNEVNVAPSLAGVPATRTAAELTAVTFTATGSDPDIPVQTLTFSLVGAPAGASINASTGVFSWTPTEAQGPSSNSFTVRVSDGVTNTAAPITITVTEVNTPPVLSVPGPQTVNEGAALTFTVGATDADFPASTLTYSAIGLLPQGATFDPLTQTFAWTPNSAQGGPNPYFVRLQASDGETVDVKEISITVNEFIADRDKDGVPDPPGYDLNGDGGIELPGRPNPLGQFEQDNCPDDPNPLQLDVCNPNSPQGTGNLSLLDAGINVTLCVTFNIGTDDTFVQLGQGGQLSLSYITCTVTNTVTGEPIEPAGTPEFLPIGLLQDGILVNAGGSLTRCKTFTLAELGFDNLPSNVPLTVGCGYINFAQLPPGDTKILTGTVTPPPQTLGTYDFTLLEPLVNQKVVNQVPVKFTLMFDGAVVSTCTCKLFVQRLDGQGNLIGSPMPAISASGGGGNIAQFNNNQYIFHLSTRNYPPNPSNGDLANGPWQIQIRPDDFSTNHNVNINVEH